MSNIINASVTETIKKGYYDYSYSVIENRAIPSIKDGLKPAQRRLIYAMSNDLKLKNSGPAFRVLRILGACAKYHPHGDSGLSTAITTMGAWFKSNVPIVEAHGSYGGLDGSEPAADRYREGKLSLYGEMFVRDLSDKSVDWELNYDDTAYEPKALPIQVPNILINGTKGIAVGYSTSIPPHNPYNVVKACIEFCKRPDITINELYEIMGPPDFPTGGIINGTTSVKSAYETGKGVVSVRGKFETSQANGYDIINVKEIPFDTTTSKLISDLLRLDESGKINLKDVNELSDNEGINIEIILKKGEDLQRVINTLYTATCFETKQYMLFHILDLDGKLKLYNLKEIFKDFMTFRMECLQRSHLDEKDKLEDRCELLNGLLILDGKFDDVIKIVRNSKSKEDMVSTICKKYGLTERQAKYVVEMPIYRLNKIEMGAVAKELKDKKGRIAFLLKVIKSGNNLKNKSLVEIMINDWENILNGEFKKFKKRNTEVIDKYERLTITDTIEDKPVKIVVTNNGYVKKLPAGITYATNPSNANLQDDDFVRFEMTTTETKLLLAVTDKGHMFDIMVHDIPTDKRGTLERNMWNGFKDYEKIVTFIEMNDDVVGKSRSLITITDDGMVKATATCQIPRISHSGKLLTKLTTKSNNVVFAGVVNPKKDQVIVITRNNQMLRFEASAIRNSGSGTSGVIAIKLKPSDEVVGACIAPEDYITVGTKNGMIKNIKVSEISTQGRGGYGLMVTGTGGFNFISSKHNGTIVAKTATGETLNINPSTIKIGKRDGKGHQLNTDIVFLNHYE